MRVCNNFKLPPIRWDQPEVITITWGIPPHVTSVGFKMFKHS